MIRSFSILAIAAFVLASCGIRQQQTRDPVEELAVYTLKAIQARSIRESREYCAWIYELGGVIRTTPVARGEYDRCRMPVPPRGARVYASLHTHGDHNPEYYSEVPSLQDVMGEIQTQTRGYIATPGGRIWLIDTDEQRIYQICGEGCIQSDATYRREDYKPIPDEFTIETLFTYFR